MHSARAAAPDLPRALLLDALADDALDQARALGCVAVVVARRLMDAALMAALRAADLRSLVYTVNEAADAGLLLGLGVDGVITDAVDRFVPDEPDCDAR